MPKVKKTITIYKELQEEDQCFEVEDFNVTLYFDIYHEKEKEFFMVQLFQFDGDIPKADNSLYIRKDNEETCGKAWTKLHHRETLKKLMKCKKYTQLTLQEV